MYLCVVVKAGGAVEHSPRARARPRVRPRARALADDVGGRVARLHMARVLQVTGPGPTPLDAQRSRPHLFGTLCATVTHEQISKQFNCKLMINTYMVKIFLTDFKIIVCMLD